MLGQAALWLLCAAIVGIVMLWERRPLSSLWLKPWKWQTLAWAGALIVLHYVVLFPATEWARQTLGLPGYAAGMQIAVSQPFWLRIVAAVTAGVVEETLYRGYAVTRILEFSGSRLLAIVVSSTVFAALHLPMGDRGVTRFLSRRPCDDRILHLAARPRRDDRCPRFHRWVGVPRQPTARDLVGLTPETGVRSRGGANGMALRALPPHE